MLFFQLKKGNEEVGDCFVTTEMIYFGIKSRIVQVDVVDISAMPEFTRLSFAERRKKLDDVLCKGVFYTHRRASTYNKGKSSLSILSTNLYALPPPLFFTIPFPSYNLFPVEAFARNYYTSIFLRIE